MLVSLPRFDALAFGSISCRVRAVHGMYACGQPSSRAGRGGLTLMDRVAASPGCWGVARAGRPPLPSFCAARVKTSLPVSRGAVPPLRPPCHPTPAQQRRRRSPPGQLRLRPQGGGSGRATETTTRCRHVLTKAICLWSAMRCDSSFSMNIVPCASIALRLSECRLRKSKFGPLMPGWYLHSEIVQAFQGFDNLGDKEARLTSIIYSSEISDNLSK